MRMRPWLEKMIESNSVSGLNWVDKVRIKTLEFQMCLFTVAAKGSGHKFVVFYR